MTLMYDSRTRSNVLVRKAKVLNTWSRSLRRGQCRLSSGLQHHTTTAIQRSESVSDEQRPSPKRQAHKPSRSHEIDLAVLMDAPAHGVTDILFIVGVEREAILHEDCLCHRYSADRPNFPARCTSSMPHLTKSYHLWLAPCGTVRRSED